MSIMTGDEANRRDAIEAMQHIAWQLTEDHQTVETLTDTVGRLFFIVLDLRNVRHEVHIPDALEDKNWDPSA